MILVFDLDDTLYPEINYVYSGFSHVASNLVEKYGLNHAEVKLELQSILEQNGRGSVFDEFLRRINRHSEVEVKRLVGLYRNHLPKLSLSKDVDLILRELGTQSNLYLVTDGNKLVQSRKCEALNLELYFRKIFITHRFGLDAAKPSLTCFKKIAAEEEIELKEIVYIGDDPHKDFVNLNRAGAGTVRINQGRFKGITLDSEYEAKIMIENFSEIRNLFAGRK